MSLDPKLFTEIITNELPVEEPVFEQRPSRVLFQIEDIDELGITLGEIGHDGGYAEIAEHDGGTLYDRVDDIVLDCFNDVRSGGWYVIEGFTVDYTADYYGEVDGGHEYESIRAARWRDVNDMLCPAPLWARALLLVGLNLRVPNGWVA